MPTIYDLVTPAEVASYWLNMPNNGAPYLGEELFPAEQKLGLDLAWLKGANGTPVVLKASAFDTKAVIRPRIGFDRLSTEMPFFKESTLVDEHDRQELNKVIQSNNQMLTDAILNRVFNDQVQLIGAAAARREQMRMALLTTGRIDIVSNGQNYSYDYGMPADHKGQASVSWSTTTADILGDIQAMQDKIEEDTGVRPTRAVVSRKTWRDMLANDAIKKAIYVLGNGNVTINSNQLNTFLADQLDGLTVAVYSKKYQVGFGANAQKLPYIPDDMFILIPEGQLGTTWFGTTPEQSDLMAGAQYAVEIVDVGVAITAIPHPDPVNVETKVTMISLPSFETADQLYIFDTVA